MWFYPIRLSKECTVHVYNYDGMESQDLAISYIGASMFDDHIKPVKTATALIGFLFPFIAICCSVLVYFFCSDWCRCSCRRCRKERYDEVQMVTNHVTT